MEQEQAGKWFHILHGQCWGSFYEIPTEYPVEVGIAFFPTLFRSSKSPMLQFLWSLPKITSTSPCFTLYFLWLEYVKQHQPINLNTLLTLPQIFIFLVISTCSVYNSLPLTSARALISLFFLNRKDILTSARIALNYASRVFFLFSSSSEHFLIQIFLNIITHINISSTMSTSMKG